MYISVYCLSLFLLLAINYAFSEVTFDDVNVDHSNKYLVLHIQKLGFANRIRVLADMSLIASMTGRILLFSWEPTPECNIEFAEIFEELPKHVRLLPFILPHGNSGTEMVKELSRRKGLSFVDLNHEGFLISGDILYGDVAVAYTDYNGVVSLEGVSCELYMHSRTKFYNTLVPVLELRNAVKDIVENYFENVVMIGIHYRAHDHVFDWNVVPPLNTADATQFGEGASVLQFQNVMIHINNHFVNVTQVYNEHTIFKYGDNAAFNPTIRLPYRFYIASNSAQAKSELMRYKYTN